jgi:hypothetical protein
MEKRNGQIGVVACSTFVSLRQKVRFFRDLKSPLIKSFIICTVIVCLSLSSCLNSTKDNDDITTKLLGTWALDSVSLPNGQFKERGSESKTLIFANNSDYSFEWWDDDVGNTFKGKYFILENPQRALKTISFVPNIQIEGDDTIRIQYMNFDIVSINPKRLHFVGETDFIKRETLPYIKFTKNYIYKRIK